MLNQEQRLESKVEIDVEQIMAEIRLRAEGRRARPESAEVLKAVQEPTAPQSRLPLYGLGRLHHEVAASNLFQDAFQAIHSRPGGSKEKVKQLAKKIISRLFRWYLWPLYEFHRSVAASLNEITSALDNLQTNLVAVARELESVKGNEGGGGEAVRALQAETQTLSGKIDALERAL
jgi:hypothetical protein